MEPIKFKDQNVVFAEDQPQYKPLPALKFQGDDGQVICCWGLSFREKIKVLFTGKVWVSLLSYNNPLTPTYLTVDKKKVIIYKKKIGKIQKYLFETLMPIYIPRKYAYLGGLCLAIWNCGTRPQTFWNALKDTRITIRKNGIPKFVIKKGDVK